MEQMSYLPWNCWTAWIYETALYRPIQGKMKHVMYLNRCCDPVPYTNNTITKGIKSHMDFGFELKQEHILECGGMKNDGSVDIGYAEMLGKEVWRCFL